MDEVSDIKNIIKNIVNINDPSLVFVACERRKPIRT